MIYFYYETRIELGNDDCGWSYIMKNNGFEITMFSKEDLLKLQDIIKDTINDYNYVNNLLKEREYELEKEQERMNEERRSTKTVRVPTKGYVYVAKCTRTGHYKIGKTKNLEARISTLKLSNSCIELFTSAKVDDIEIERIVHKEFDNYRLNGE
jgi:hypothetical protein